MSANPEREDMNETAENQAVRTRLDAIADGLMQGTEEDARFASGVPQEQRGDALDFIQMSGLTRPVDIQSSSPVGAVRAAGDMQEGMDPTQPVSFYEKGVADVDHTMGPLAMEASADAASENLVPPPPPLVEEYPPTPGVPPSKSVDALKDIIAELTGESSDAQEAVVEDVSEPEAALGGLDAVADEVAELASPVPDEVRDERPVEMPQALELAPAVEDSSSIPEVASTPVEEEESALDFDTIIDATENLDDVPIAEPVSEEVPMEEVREGSGALQEAEALLEELEQQPREDVVTGGVDGSPDSHAFGMNYDLSASREENPNRWEWPDTNEASGSEQSATAPRGRSHRHRGWKRRMARRLVLLTALASVVGAVALLFFVLIRPALYQPQDLRDVAANHLSAGKYSAASVAYGNLANRYTANSPERGEALFNAAQALYQSPEANGPAGAEYYQEILGYLDAFVAEYPEHPKRLRANILMGVSLYKTGAYDEAITVLQRAVEAQSDPMISLPLMRSLARAYVAKGAFEEAESAYLQVVSVAGNYSLDVDYYALGNIFVERARLAGEVAGRDAFLRDAEAYWSKAIQVPTIDPTLRESIRREMSGLGSESIVSAPVEEMVEETGVADSTVVTEEVVAGDENISGVIEALDEIEVSVD
jgi:tetratricopeptide (TPR) repeat protein